MGLPLLQDVVQSMEQAILAKEGDSNSVNIFYFFFLFFYIFKKFVEVEILAVLWPSMQKTINPELMRRRSSDLLMLKQLCLSPVFLGFFLKGQVRHLHMS